MKLQFATQPKEVSVVGPPVITHCNSPMCRGAKRKHYLDHATPNGTPVLVCAVCGAQKVGAK
jgi:hypothetical protein